MSIHAFGTVETTQGLFGWVTRDDVLVATYLPMAQRELYRRIRRDFPDAVESGRAPAGFADQVRAYFRDGTARFTVPVDLSQVAPFARRVLKECMRIPPGRTTTYAELAVRAGRPGAARAVGNAMARNPLPLVVPCHRVLRSDGTMGGFSAPRGVSLKREMLRREGALP